MVAVEENLHSVVLLHWLLFYSWMGPDRTGREMSTSCAAKAAGINLLKVLLHPPLVFAHCCIINLGNDTIKTVVIVKGVKTLLTLPISAPEMDLDGIR